MDPEDDVGHGPTLGPQRSAGALDPGSAQGLALIDAEVTRQAATLAYLEDFRLMMWVTLAAVPLIVLLRPSKAAPGEAGVAMAE